MSESVVVRRIYGPIKINGNLIPIEVTGYEWFLADLDGAEGTGRSDSTGELFRDRIARVRSIKLDFGPSTVAQMSELLHLVQDEFVDITYLDAFDGDWRTDEFHVADRGVSALMWDGELIPGETTDFSNVRWGPCSFEFVGKGNPI